MSTTIDEPKTETRALSRRRRYQSGTEVVAAVEVLAKRGFKRPHIGAVLGMSGAHNGGLQTALRRAERYDLLRAIALDAREPTSDQALALAALQRKDPEEFERCRLALLSDVYAELIREPEGPTLRAVRGPGGIVRWVA